ncbi:MAG: hypothetical protein R3A44_38380 [Caldilineaceae bacterium]
MAFRSHYLFESRYCTPGAGNEKGQVEDGVGYARRNFMTPLLQVADYGELNVQACWRRVQPTRCDVWTASRSPSARCGKVSSLICAQSRSV